MSSSVSAILRAATLGLAAATLLCLASDGASAGVYNDVTAWWQFDMADSGTIIDPNAIRDARDWYNAGGYVAAGVQGTPEWTTVSVPGKLGGGQVYGGRGMEFTPAVSGTTVTPDGFTLNDPANTLTLTGDATLVTRFKWDGYVIPGNPSAWLYNNAHTANGGWLFGLNGGDANPRFLRYPTGSYAPGWKTTAGTWYDMAVVVDDANDTLTFYRWEENGEFQSQTFSNVNWDFNALGTTGTYVGFESPSGGNAQKAFDGTVDHLAVWNRALSAAEIRDAFGAPDPFWSIGLDNNTNADFNIENPTGADYTLGEPWGKLARAVTQYGVKQVDVHFDATQEEAALPYIFHLDTASARAPGLPLTLSINGQLIGTQDVTANQDYEWLVPAGSLNAGTNTLSLHYDGPTVDYGDGGTYVTWDWMELGGSWQVGFDNNTPAEFRAESAAYTDDFYVTDPQWQHLERALTAGDPTINLHFNLSDELALHDFDYITEVIGQSPASGNAFDVSINGYLLGEVPASPDNTVLSFYIPARMLQSGENVLSLQYQAGGGWTQFDYHRLQVHVPEPASVVLLGVGVVAFGAVAARRHRRRRSC